MSELLITREITSELARMIRAAVSHVLYNTDDRVPLLRHVRTGTSTCSPIALWPGEKGAGQCVINYDYPLAIARVAFVEIPPLNYRGLYR